MEQEKKLSEQESLALITQMINRAKEAYYSTGLDAIMWGSVIAVCSLVRLSEIHFGYKLPFDIYLLTIVALIPQVFIVIKEKKEKKVRTYNDAFISYLWLGFGISIFLLILIINNIFSEWGAWTDKYQSATDKSSPGFYEFVAPLFLMIYGMPTFVTGATCKFKPMLLGGIFCWICCIATIYTSIKIDLLLTALAAMIAWLIPGILIKIEHGRIKKEQAHLNV